MLPIKLNMIDFLSHANSEIDFTKFNAALVLGTQDGNSDRSNGSGKSAIFEAIMWALFGKSRHKKADGVVKRGARRCKVEFIFDIDNARYKIIRKRDRVLGESDLVFERYEDGEWISISSDTNTATGANITKTINVNNNEVFVNSIYFKQNDISMFPEATPGKRKDIIKSLLRMERWDAYQKKASSKSSKIKSSIEEKQSLAIDLTEIKESIAECNKFVKNIKTKIAEKNESYNELSLALIENKLKLKAMQTANPEELKRLRKEYSAAKNRSSEISESVTSNNLTIETNSSDIFRSQKRMLDLNNKIRAGKSIDLDKMRNSILNGTSKVKVLKQQIDQNKEVSFDSGKCHVCSKPVSKKELACLKDKSRDDLALLRDKHGKFTEKLKRARSTLAESEIIHTSASNSEIRKGKLSLKINKLQNELENVTLENQRFVTELGKIRSRDYKSEICKLESSLDKDRISAIEVLVSNAARDLSNIKRSIDSMNVEYGSKVSNKKDLSKQLADQEILHKEITKLKGEHLIYDKLKNYFGKDGIQAIIIENVIEELENYSNETLGKICNEPTSISINTQRQTDSGSWAETFDIEVTSGGRTDEFSTFSGGEQFRVSLAIRLALSKILSGRMGGTLNFLLLDEVSSSLDNSGLSMFIDIVKKLSESMKVLVITHDSNLKESFDYVITVDKSANDSSILVT